MLTPNRQNAYKSRTTVSATIRYVLLIIRPETESANSLLSSRAMSLPNIPFL